MLSIKVALIFFLKNLGISFSKDSFICELKSKIEFPEILVLILVSCGKQTSAHASHFVDKEISRSSVISLAELNLKKTVTWSLYPKVIKGG